MHMGVIWKKNANPCALPLIFLFHKSRMGSGDLYFALKLSFGKHRSVHLFIKFKCHFLKSCIFF